MTIRPLSLAALCAGVLSASAFAQETPDQPFEAWRDGFIDRAIAAGHPEDVIRTAFTGVEPQPRLLKFDRNQPEFVRPIWEYLDSAVSNTRIVNGQASLTEHQAVLARCETLWGVPASHLAAIWGVESAYGAVMGDFDVVSSLATLAWDGRRRELFESELAAVFDLLRTGLVERDQLTGGWAGAMGHTQFMPSTLRNYAVDYDGDGRVDLWGSEGDALGSAARYLAEHGWRRGEPWGIEVRAQAGFDYALTDGRALPVREWIAAGVARADGAGWDAALLDAEAKALAPAGARGPVFLTLTNFEVIKRYNNSTSYALAVGLLGDRLAGRPGLVASWPEDEPPLAIADVEALQRNLLALGHDPKGVDGKVGPATRAAVRGYQLQHGLVADGFPARALIERIAADAQGVSGD